ncbi:MAG: helix-turn-helix transcriptional regulator [Bacteroidetes bacterium]|nr:helix-turn-helix transcriptional regulator [Bacteroidota bacterium]MBS1926015.1 helix-turn-helix transcriptional regulator [Bacteroidota bacterium]HRD42737.1 helix-turn-helix transcriptional regulator [Ferruginibacter sp.]
MKTPTAMNFTIGEKIRILRNIKGFSQKGLASCTGQKQECISYIESNKMKKPLNRSTLAKLAGAFDLTPEQLERFDPSKFVYNHFEENAKQDIFIQSLIFSSNDKILTLQQETIETLQKLNDMYKEQLKAKS